LGVAAGGSINFSFNWNEQVGVHTIDYTINYSDGTQSQDPFPVTVNVVKPKVNSFTLNYGTLAAGPYIDGNVNYNGVHLGAGVANPGMSLGASVNMTGVPGSGNFNFIEIINSQNKVTVNGDPGSPYTRNTVGDVLDNVPSYNMVNNVFMLGDAGTTVGGSSDTPVPPANYRPANGAAPPGKIPDAPFLAWYGGQTPWDSIDVTDTFKIYLTFTPGGSLGGLTIALSRIDFSLNGQAMSNNNGGYSFLPPLPGDPPTYTPAMPGVANGVDDVKFLTWTNSFFPDRSVPGLQGIGTYWKNAQGNPELPPGSL